VFFVSPAKGKGGSLPESWFFNDEQHNRDTKK
jgi:hypothetical protein